VYVNDGSVSGYKLGIGDSVDIRVWKNDDLSVLVPIRPDGMISLPLAGEISALGKTPLALRQEISVKLAKFVRNPEVTVIVTNPESVEFHHRVRITGAITNALSTPWKDGMTVLDLVLMAGGLSEYASGNGAILYRKSDGSVKAYQVDLDDILNKGRLETNYSLAPSDIITIPERVF